MDQKQLKTAAISAACTAFILLAFVLGMKLFSGPAANTPAWANPTLAESRTTDEPINTASIDLLSKPPAQAQDTVMDHLIATKSHLQEALDSLNKATGNNKGGYDIKGRADLAQALSDISDAIDFAKNHPDIAQLPAPETRLDISNQVQVGRNLGNVAPNLRNALNSLQAALEEFHNTPGGDMGGFRDKVLADIQLAASDTAAGITIASRGRAGPNVGRGGPDVGRGLPGGALPPDAGGG